MNGTGSRQRGSSIVEFALVAPVFFFLFLAVIEFGILFWVNLTMQHAVREGARYAVTGQSNLDPNASDQQRYNAVIQDIKNNSMGLYGMLNPTIAITINGGSSQSYSNSASYNGGMFGGPGDIIVLQLNCAWPIITPLAKPFFAGTDGQYQFSVAATMRNEAF
ncbi:MAG: TadE/TadG family type IV pilus assembly protein [Rhodocyclaceae bacterium]|nr:TadE/TadG family type IV pilus assembly protein [Rhodocyclaceae bacterium]